MDLISAWCLRGVDAAQPPWETKLDLEAGELCWWVYIDRSYFISYSTSRQDIVDQYIYQEIAW